MSMTAVERWATERAIYASARERQEARESERRGQEVAQGNKPLVLRSRQTRVRVRHDRWRDRSPESRARAATRRRERRHELAAVGLTVRRTPRQGAWRPHVAAAAAYAPAPGDWLCWHVYWWRAGLVPARAGARWLAALVAVWRGRACGLWTVRQQGKRLVPLADDQVDREVA